ncbi:unnamed protein product [Laminaria digitata]
MWASSGAADSVNVNERVIIAGADVESGTWTVRVSTNGLTTESQSYSLVVNGAIVYSSSSAPFVTSSSSAGMIASTPISMVALLVGAAVSAIAAACAA